MPVSKSMKVLSARMRWDTQNIQVSSNNLARSGLPGQTARKLVPFNFTEVLKSSKSAKSSSVTTTHSRHISTSQSSAPYDVKESKSKKGDTDITKNNINPHEEMMSINESNTQFLQNSNLYRKMVQNYKLFSTVSK
tara:strand:- start:565 stop:972 length:408 start_codon:yes stop_codon:yes gene_type:complete